MTIALVFESTGDHKRAVDFYVLAAHLQPKDIQLWKQLAAKSQQLGLFRQAIYCLTKAISFDRQDADLKFQKAMLLAEASASLGGGPRLRPFGMSCVKTPTDFSSVWRSCRSPQTQSYARAIDQMEAVRRRRPADPEVIQHLAK